jgi:hypothetical protein
MAEDLAKARWRPLVFGFGVLVLDGVLLSTLFFFNLFSGYGSDC